MTKIENPELERVAPEDVGIKSSAIKAFIDEINEKKLELHSFMVVRHDKICAECFWKPYGPDIPHVLYSMSKSITATAVGFAIEDGLLQLDDPIYKFFPEYNVQSARNRSITVRMLLTMCSDKLITVVDEKGGRDWIESFFKAPFMTKPGKKFNYISENTFMLSAVVSKVTGKSVVDYLDEKMFRPLGIEKPFWETDGKGNNVGGWGLYMKTQDLANFFLPYLHGGKYKGVQILPEKWAKAAVSKQFDNLKTGYRDNTCGYGFNFWRCHVPGTFRAEGLLSQRCMFFPEQDALVVLTAGHCKDYEVMDVFWKHFPACFETASLPEDEAARSSMLQTAEACHMEDLPAAPRRSDLESKISGRTMRCKTNAYTSVISVSIVQMLFNKPGKINEMRLDFDDDGLSFTWKEKLYQNTLRAGMDGNYRVSDIAFGDLHFHAYAKAAWTPEGRLQLWIRPVETAHVRKLTFTFTPGGAKVVNTSQPKMGDLAVFYIVFSGIVLSPAMERIVQGVVRTIGLPLVEPNIRTRFLK